MIGLQFNVYARYTLFLHNYTLYGKRYNMGKMSREKGKRGEREIASKLREYGYNCHRGQQFSGANGDADVVGLPGVHLEIKRVEKLNLYDAMSQAIRDANAAEFEEYPVVMHRKNNCEWLVTMRFDDWIHLYSEWDAGNIPFLKGDDD